MNIRWAIALGAAALLSGCNMWGGLDGPSGDEQLLSAARACLDRQDYGCATKYYSQLSGAELSTAAAEEAFLILDQNGATMGTFMNFVGNLGDHNPGYALTKFAESLVSGAGGSAGVAKRVQIWGALSNRASVTGDATLQSFVEFMTATALTAEILAEAAGSDGAIRQSNLATNPQACISAGLACATTAGCDAPAATVLTAASGTPDVTTTQPNNANPSLDQLKEAITLAYQGLHDLSAAGKFGSATDVLNTLKIAPQPSSATPGTDRCFRQLLLTNNIGE